MSDLAELLKQQEELTAKIEDAKKEAKKALKGDFAAFIENSGFSKDEVLEALNLVEAKKSRAPAIKTQSYDIEKGTVFVHENESFEWGKRGKRPSWLVSALENGTYKELIAS